MLGLWVFLQNELTYSPTLTSHIFIQNFDRITIFIYEAEVASDQFEDKVENYQALTWLKRDVLQATVQYNTGWHSSCFRILNTQLFST